MGETLPTRLDATCIDCGSTTTVTHPNGLGGEGRGWPCPVCGNPMTMHGSDYAPTTEETS